MRKWWQPRVYGIGMGLALIVASPFLSGCGAGGPIPMSAKAAAGEKVYQIVVPDIVCASCAATIRRKLEKTEGVKQIVIDLEKKTLEVGVDAASHPSDSKLRDAITEAGYLKAADDASESG